MRLFLDFFLYLYNDDQLAMIMKYFFSQVGESAKNDECLGILKGWNTCAVCIKLRGAKSNRSEIGLLCSWPYLLLIWNCLNF